MNTKHFFLYGFLITIGMISYGDVRYCQQMPWPPRFIAAGLVFGILDLVSGLFSEEVMGLVALGIVLAAIVSGGFHSDCSRTGAVTTAQAINFEPIQPTTVPSQVV